MGAWLVLLRPRRPTLALPRRRRVIWWLGTIWVLHVLAMMWLEGLSFGDANWLTATSMVTVGYGDLSSKTTLGRLATGVLVYAGGVFVLASAVGSWSEHRAEQRQLKLTGKWRWKMPDGYMLIVSPLGNETSDYYVRLVSEIRAAPDWADVAILIMSPTLTELPEALRTSHVVHRVGTGLSSELAGDVERARTVVVLGDSRNPVSDALVFDLVSRIPKNLHVVAEVVDDASRPRFTAAGAEVMVRPMRGYPEMLARAVTTPGCERIIEELFSGAGQTVVCVPLASTGSVTVDCAKARSALDDHRLGTLLALQDHDGMKISPHGINNAQKAFVLAQGTVDRQAVAKVLLESWGPNANRR